MATGWEVIFDGRCRLCQASRRRLEKGLAGLPVVFLDGHSLGLKEEQFTALVVRTPEGQQLLGFEAVVTLLALRWRWPWLGRFLLRPPFRQIGSWGYRLVAANRHRWFRARV